MSKEKLESWIKSEIQKVEDVGGEIFLDIPEKWFDPTQYGCENGHVSIMYLKSEALGSDVCLACHKPVYIIPPGM